MMKSDYDSTLDTTKHILVVRELLGAVTKNLMDRSVWHDLSKLQPIEKPMYDEFTPKLRAMTYGSDEYKQALIDMGSALQHHYRSNSHHPEHFENGVDGMSLLDLIEMLADWAVAVKRHADGDLMTSLEINKERFGMTEQLASIFANTAREMGWVE